MSSKRKKTSLAQTLSALIVATAIVAPAPAALAQAKSPDKEVKTESAGNPCSPGNPCGPDKKKKKKKKGSDNPCAPGNPCAPKKD